VSLAVPDFDATLRFGPPPTGRTLTGWLSSISIPSIQLHSIPSILLRNTNPISSRSTMSQPRAAAAGPSGGAAAAGAPAQNQGGWDQTLKSALRSVAMFLAIQMGE
jgi:hypothetical protein